KVPGCSTDLLDLPVGCEQGTVALYRTEGPFLHSISLSASPDRVQAGKTFVVKVSGNLAGRILSVGGQDLTCVTVDFLDTTLKSQSSHLVNVLDDGSFVVTSDWIFETSGKYEISVRIYAAKRAYPTNTDIILVVVADVPDPVEFIWHFGDSTSAKTTSRTISKRYSKPGRFDVVVVMSSGQTSVASKVLPLEVQRAVKLNRLVHQASVLQKQTVTVSCRVNVGTNLTFLWSFGDGSSSLGQSTEQYVYHSTGEFRIEVTVSNLVSSASLSSHIFVVDRPCQPPPVKNMGPLELQVWRYESVRLGVTYENDMNCDTAAGLHYSWALLDSVGQIFPLPRTDTHRQSLILPSHLLHYETYTAMARVQVIGSVVYSNYSVKVKVMPSPPVAFIQGGTNIFINNRNTTLVVLDGQRSYDPDFPLNPLSYSWTCKPVSSVTSSCFNQHIPSSSPVLTFPVGFLKPNFDQFQVTLTIHSRGHSASSETFITITPNVLGKVSLYCPQCSGDQVNWDQPFSVTAKCEDCGVSSDMIQYSWRLYLVNASSKPVTEVPFCHKVDLSAPSTVIKGPATSTETPPAIDTADYTHDSVPVFLTEAQSLSSSCAGEEILYRPLGEFDPAEYHPSAEYPPLALENSGGLYSDHLGNVFSEFPNDPDSSADWEFSLPVLETGDVGDPDYDVSLTSADEGDPGISAGRPTGVDGETFSLGEDSVFGSTVHEDEGSNLVDPRPSAGIQEQTLLDLPRDPVDRRLFQSYTFTGTSSSLLSFRPFSLMPGSRYMLEVTAKSKDGLLGRTQLFFKTQPAPKGVTCQVQPVKGMELHTHFSIFCTSGKEDLMYEYSFSVGGRTPRMMYQGRDFQYYFRLPSGDPSDDYKVTIYIEIRSTYGTATKPCPVTVQVHPKSLKTISSHHMKNIHVSSLVQLGNSVEIRNYISLLGSILNRLSQDTEANTLTQTRLRTVLICTVCELESSEQMYLKDEMFCLILFLRVIVHIQAISDQFLESSSPVQYSLDSKTLNTLITVLSHTLQAAAFSPESSLITQALESDSPNGENMTTTVAAPRGCTSESQTGTRSCVSKHVSSYSLLVSLHLTSNVSFQKYILSHEAREHNISAGLITLYATYLNSTVISSGSTTFHIPVSLMQHLFVCVSGECKNEQRRPCVLSVLTELAHSPYTWVPYTTKLNGPVVDLNLYKCSTRRKIHIHSFVQPINIELQLPQRNERSVREYVLLHNQVNYHSFNITQEHLQQAIQLSVTFKPLSSKVFPIMLLFRMFDRPTSSMHHLHRIHRWESNTTCITLPPSYLNTAGVGHLALLNAGKAPRHKHLSEQIRYSLTVASSLCLSWDSHQGAWTHQGCRTQQTDTDTVNCSCYQLRPLTVVQQQLEGSHDSADLGSFLSVSRDLTVPGVLVLCLCLYILGRVLCKKADMVFKQNHRVHYLPDNSASDPYFYVATIHTGICSAACMSAKVYIVLYGEDGTSQTRELQVPGCTLFRRNSQDTFIISTEDSLGLVWGVHIWHDNSGPSPQWYLKQVEVSEVNRDYVKGRAWLFVGQCWLAVSKGDGKVERMLRVCTQGIGFAKMLSLKLSDYLADYHIWISVLICPSPNAFTHSQRLTVCLLLLLGYTCVNTVMISQMDEQLPLELGIIDISATSVTTGILSALAVLPAATVISCLFRWRKVKIMGSGVQHAKGRKIQKDDFEDLPSMSTMILKNKDTHEERAVQSDVIVRKEDALTCGSSVVPEDKEFDQSPRGNEFDYLSKSEGALALSGWLYIVYSLQCHTVTVTVCLFRFRSSQVLLWIHSLFFSLMSCIFFIQPVMILTVAVLVSLWYRKRSDFHSFFSVTEFEIKDHNGAIHPKEHFTSSVFPLERPSCLEEVISSLYFSLISSASFKNHLSFHRDHDNAFMSIQKHEDWWKWTQTSLPNLLYKNVSIKTEVRNDSHILIGEPILRKMEAPRTFQCWVCNKKRCHGVNIVIRSDAVSRLKHLHSSGWLGGETVAISVHFTLYSPAPNLFTSVTLLTEQSPTGVLLPSSKVQSVRVYRTPAVWDYVVMICQLLFLLFSLLQLCLQVSTIGQQGLMGYCRTPYNWLEVSLILILLTVTFVYYVYYVYHSVLTMELVEQLQTHNYRGHADVNLLATWEQHIRTLCGVTLFLLTTKCVTLLRANRTLAPSATLLIRSLVSLFRPVISGLILLVALSCVGNLLFVQNWAFSSLPRSLQTVFCYYRGHRADRGLHLSGHYFLSDGVLCLSSTVVWIAVVHIKKIPLCKNIILGFFFQTYYLEEFELLVDELLFRLDALSNSLHHTLPSKAHCYVEESPVISPVQESSHVDTQVRQSDVKHQLGKKAEENPNDRELQTYLRGQSCLVLPASDSLIRVWTEDVLEKQADQWTKTKNYCCLKPQATHTEVVVEALVHEEPESEERGQKA
uniref:Polycystic kidney disease 1b n=1 Tax=Anabas testudineus TaxID=64144 RepID=A0A3Q1IV35_ANATE